MYYFGHGGRYTGHWKHNFEHGQGTLFSSNGEKYEGEWKRGKKVGKGTMYHNDGREEFMEFEEA